MQAVEVVFIHSDTGGLFHKVKQQRAWLVPGWMTACLSSWATQQTLYLVTLASGGMGDDITIISRPRRPTPWLFCIGSALRSAVCSQWLQDSQEKMDRNVTSICI